METIIKELTDIINLYTFDNFYIGQTNNPKVRIKQHYKSKNFLSMIVVYESSKEIINILEYTTINIFKDFKTNLNNQIYTDNNYSSIKGENIYFKSDIDIPDVEMLNDEDKQYLYIAFPYIAKVQDFKYIDYLTVSKSNKKITVYSNLTYKSKTKKIKLSPGEICNNKIKTLAKQYQNKYKNIKIRSTKDYNLTKLKMYQKHKDRLIKFIYRNSDVHLIKDLKKQLQKQQYLNFNNKKEGKYKRLVKFIKRFKGIGDNQIYIMFY